MVGTMKFEARIKELVENLPDLAVLVEPLLIVRWVLREQFGILHRRLLAIVRDEAASSAKLRSTAAAFNDSGSLAILMAMRCASSRVSRYTIWQGISPHSA